MDASNRAETTPSWPGSNAIVRLVSATGYLTEVCLNPLLEFEDVVEWGSSISEEFHQDRCERLWADVVSLALQRA